MTDLFAISRADKVAELKREIAMRRQVYGRQVAAGRMTQEKADRGIAVMEAIIADYELAQGASLPPEGSTGGTGAPNPATENEGTAP